IFLCITLSINAPLCGVNEIPVDEALHRVGLDATADEKEIEKQCRKLMAKYHPDNSKTGNESQFKDINNACQSLKDPDADFRQARENARRHAEAHQEGWAQFNEWFGKSEQFAHEFYDEFFSQESRHLPYRVSPLRALLSSSLVYDFPLWQ